MTKEEIEKQAAEFAAQWQKTSNGSHLILPGGSVTYAEAMAGFARAIAVQVLGHAARAADTYTVPANAIHENHPLIPVQGHFRNDPTWNDFMESMRDYRRQLNETED